VRRALAVATVALALLAGPASAAQDPFAGIPQDGFAAGDPGAPVTVRAYFELQCPFCRAFDRLELPAFLEQYVRTGRARLVMRPLAFLGRDSVRAARMVAAAAGQDRAWPLAHQLYLRQRRENSGWVTDRVLRRAARAVPGLRVRRAMKERNGRAAIRRLRVARRAARRAGVSGTPSFTLARAGAPEQLLDLDENTAAALGAAVDAALSQP
jgi:protein-disulfide isomerase